MFVFNPNNMGNSIYNKGLQFHVNKERQQRIPYFNIMLQWINDILDKQAGILEAKGVKIIFPIVAINVFIMSFFAKINFAEGFDLIKNIILSLAGCAVAIMGVVNMYLAMMQRIKKYKKGEDVTGKDKEKAA